MKKWRAVHLAEVREEEGGVLEGSGERQEGEATRNSHLTERTQTQREKEIEKQQRRTR